MSEQTSPEIILAFLNRLNGWWRIWLLLLGIALLWGVYDGFVDRSKWYGRLQRDFTCIPGTVESAIEFAEYDSRPIAVQSCATYAGVLRNVSKRGLPVFLLLPLFGAAVWIIRGFKREVIK